MSNSNDPTNIIPDDQIHLPDDDDDTKSPARQDIDREEGVEWDDDVDELGEDIGITYDENEPLDITKKYNINPQSEPPTENDEE